MSSTLRVILDEKLTSANWHLRQAALIWLFVLMKRGGRWHPAIKATLDQLQEAFIDGLAETNGASNINAVFKNYPLFQTYRRTSPARAWASYTKWVTTNKDRPWWRL